MESKLKYRIIINLAETENRYKFTVEKFRPTFPFLIKKWKCYQSVTLPRNDKNCGGKDTFVPFMIEEWKKDYPNIEVIDEHNLL
jgi:hypothetical protein